MILSQDIKRHPTTYALLLNPFIIYINISCIKFGAQDANRLKSSGQPKRRTRRYSKRISRPTHGTSPNSTPTSFTPHGAPSGKDTD